MSPLQIIKQLRRVVRAAAWDGGSNEVVLGDSTYITPQISADASPFRVAFCLITAGPITADTQDPGLISAEFLVVIAQDVKGDPLNENSMIGGAREGGDIGSTKGKGVMEIAVPILDSIRSLVGSDGLPVIVSYGGSPEIDTLPGEDQSEVITQTFVVTSVCTTEDEWPAPSELQLSGSDLTWTSAATMVGFREYIIRGSGTSTPPAGPTDGVPVFAGTGNMATDATGSVSFAIFAAYTETGAAVNHRFSEQERGTTA